MLRYHGSTVRIENELRPHKAFNRADYKPCVYTKEDKTLATLYAVNPIRAYFNDDSNEKGIPAFSAHFQHDAKPGEPIKIYEIYKGFFEELFNRRAYIYVVEVDGEETEEISKNVPIKERICIENMFEYLKKLHEKGVIEIVNYENLPYDFLFDKISSKISVAETQYEADFYMAKFPQFKNDIPSKFRN